MAVILRVRVTGSQDVARYLRALKDDLDPTVRDVLETHADHIADMARGFLHHGAPSWPTSSAARLYPEGIRHYYEGGTGDRLAAEVWSEHPAAPVWEWGGVIRPAGHPIFIPRDLPVSRAAEADQPALRRDVEDAIDRLITEHGF